MRFPFEASPDELQTDLPAFVDAVFSCLESEFLVMPKGEGFIEYPVFEQGYEALKASTSGFTEIEAGSRARHSGRDAGSAPGAAGDAGLHAVGVGVRGEPALRD